MAGIGFEMRKALRKGSYSGALTAYLAAGVVSSGPWIIALCAIAALGVLLPKILGADRTGLLVATITHVFAIAFVLVGPLNLLLTRYAADCFSEKRKEDIFPAYLAGLGVAIPIAGLLGGIFFFRFVPGDFIYRMSATSLLVFVTCTFVTANFLGALKHYGAVVFSFAVGYGVSGVAAFYLGREHGLSIALAGFAAGQGLLFACLFASLAWELPQKGGSGGWRFLWSVFRFPGLALCGFAYALGIWVDKFIFWWFSPDRLQVAGAIFVSPSYDVATYLALLAIIPGMAILLMRLETEFAERYEHFFELLNGTGTLDELEEARAGIADCLRSGITELIKVQGLVTFVLVVYAPEVASFFRVGVFQTGIFRITLFGSLFLVAFLALLTVLFYFDDRKGALGCSLLFLACNTGFAVLSLSSSAAYYGVGFVAASGIAMMVATLRANAYLGRLEFKVFSSQPLGSGKKATA